MSGSTGIHRDDELELRIADWLEDGPSSAPAASVEAVVNRIRRSPRKHPTVERVRRIVLGSPPGDALEFRPRAGSRAWLAVAACVVLAIGWLLVPSLARTPPTGDEPSERASASPRVTPSAVPSATPTILSSLPVTLTGTSTCATQDEGTATQVGTTRMTTGIVVRCFDRSSDPRVGGVGYRNYSTVIDADGVERWSGTATSTNDGGDWSGVFSGSRPAGSPYLTLATTWLGSNGYEGLQIRDRVRIQVDDGSIEILTSVLEVVRAVDATGVATCEESAASLSPAPPTPAPDRILACTVDVDEPRLSGVRRLFLTMVRLDDGSTAISGTSRIENAAGTWDAQVSGAIDADGVTCRIDEIATGSGLYAGFEFSGHLAGPIDALVITGTIAPAP